MVSMFFGQYLLEKGVIRREALLDALQRQRRVNRPLLHLAVERGLVSQQQAETAQLVLRSSDQPIERICVEMGYLTPAQVEDLQNVQRAHWLRIGDALVEGGHLTDKQVGEHLGRFQQSLAAVEQHLETELEGFDDAATIKAFFNLSAYHFSRITGRTAKLRSIDHCAEAHLAPGSRRFAQHFVGDRNLWLAVDLPDVLATSLATGLLGSNGAPDQEAVQDAVCEFVNVVGGNACTRVEVLGCVLRPEPPITAGPGEPLEPSGPSVRAVAVVEEDEFELHLMLESASRE